MINRKATLCSAKNVANVILNKYFV